MTLQLISRSEGKLPTYMNFGCGNTIHDDTVNIDTSVSETIAMKAKSFGKNAWLYKGLWTDPHEFPVDHFNMVLAHDVLEHIHPDAIGNMLYCFRCCMKIGGILEINVPDFEHIAQLIANHKIDDEMSIDWLSQFRRLELIWMAPYIHGGIGHQSIWTKAMARYRLEGEGFMITNMKTIDLSLSITAKRV